ncbi:MAG: sigma-70 family RNA polymerase sigma factor [Planctomycetota bacterium]|jgi:RNA polymerase sigma-70 factor (ECF subfamily)|nr:sigma-70 family RNA polymerase sigma factor [Planctomycetota bacterium]
MPLPKFTPKANQAPDNFADDLFEQYAGKIYGLALKCGLAPRDAEDGVQEVFLKVQRKLGTFRGEAAFSTWLYRVALNTLRDHRRKVSRYARSQSLQECEETNSMPAASASYPNPSIDAERNERRDLVRQALDRLPDNFRQVLVLRELEGLSYRDISRILEVKQGTIESRIYRARTRLALEISNLEDDLND